VSRSASLNSSSAIRKTVLKGGAGGRQHQGRGGDHTPRDADQLKSGGPILVSAITGTKDADIEDLFDRDFYIEFVNRAYASEIGDKPSSRLISPRRSSGSRARSAVCLRSASSKSSITCDRR
jgi:hypothetical protein